MIHFCVLKTYSWTLLSHLNPVRTLASIIIFPCHVLPSLEITFFRSGFPNKNLYMRGIFVSPMRATCPNVLVSLFRSPNVIRWGTTNHESYLHPHIYTLLCFALVISDYFSPLEIMFSIKVQTTHFDQSKFIDNFLQCTSPRHEILHSWNGGRTPCILLSALPGGE